jgi:integrase
LTCASSHGSETSASRSYAPASSRFAADLERAGTGRATIVSTLAVLQGVMKRAVRDYNLPGNPVKQIDKPSQRRERDPVLITVEQVEAMRHWCMQRDDPRSATLISLLAYAGARPESEALALRWDGVRRRTILFRATKRGVPYERATRLLGPLAEDLRDGARHADIHPPTHPSCPTAAGSGGPTTTGTTGAAARSAAPPRPQGCAPTSQTERGGCGRATCARASRPC